MFFLLEGYSRGKKSSSLAPSSIIYSNTLSNIFIQVYRGRRHQITCWVNNMKPHIIVTAFFFDFTPQLFAPIIFYLRNIFTRHKAAPRYWYYHLLIDKYNYDIPLLFIFTSCDITFIWFGDNFLYFGALSILNWIHDLQFW